MLDAAEGRADEPEAAAAAREAAEFAYRRDLYAISLQAAELWLERARRGSAGAGAGGGIECGFRPAGARDCRRPQGGWKAPATAERFMEAFAGSSLRHQLRSGCAPGRWDRVTAELARQFPDSPGVLVLAARIALRGGQHDQALGHADALLKRNPEDDGAPRLPPPRNCARATRTWRWPG